MRVLLTGWFSFLHGEATAGDLLALDAVRSALGAAGISNDTAWSPVFRPGGPRIEDAAPARYTHLVFVCGPLHGEPVAALHARYASARRIAVGVSVIDPASPAHAGFDLVLARDGGPGPPHRDLAAAAPQFRAAAPQFRAAACPAPRTGEPAAAGPPVPVTGVILATGQGEYGDRRRHDLVTAQLTHWLAAVRFAPLELDTRLDSRDWRLCSTAEAFAALVSRLDVVVTTRLHGLVLALGRGIPVLAVDPVAGTGKVTAQAHAWEWPAIVPAEGAADPRLLDRLWNWCLSARGRDAAADHRAALGPGADRSPFRAAAVRASWRDLGTLNQEVTGMPGREELPSTLERSPRGHPEGQRPAAGADPARRAGAGERRLRATPVVPGPGESLIRLVRESAARPIPHPPRAAPPGPWGSRACPRSSGDQMAARP